MLVVCAGEVAPRGCEAADGVSWGRGESGRKLIPLKNGYFREQRFTVNKHKRMLDFVLLFWPTSSGNAHLSERCPRGTVLNNPYAPKIQMNTRDNTPNSAPPPKSMFSSSSSHDQILNQPSVPHARKGNALSRSRSLAPLEFQISRGKAQDPELVDGLLLVIPCRLERRSLELRPRVGRDGDQQLETKSSAL